MKFSLIEHGSPSYEDELALRDEVLRKPLGLNIADDDLSRESGQLHFGLFEENELIACVIAVPHSEGVAQIRQMAVARSKQGTGRGRTIMEEMETHLQKRGITKLFLHARVPVMGFYQKLGFSPVGDQFTEVGIPHQKMVKIPE